jgi:hypothetical protein
MIRGVVHRRGLAVVFCAAAFLVGAAWLPGWLPSAHADSVAEILYDSFETPDISGRADAVPVGWLREHGYSRMWDEDSGDITTPFGSQVIAAWVDSGFQTTNITDVLQPGTTYRLTFNVGNCSADTGAPYTDNQYTAYLLAGTNVIGSVSGVTTNDDLSVSNSVTVVTDGTHPHLGETLGVRLSMTAGNYRANALFDNVRLVAEESAEWARSLFYGK